MPFVKNTNIKNNQQPINNRRIFVGRTNEIQFFRENILRPEEPSYNIVSIFGQAGIGKSTLLTHFMEEARSTDFKDYCLTALVDERQTTEADIMAKFAEQLPLEGTFEKLLDSYNETLRKLQIERFNKHEDFLKRAATDVAGTMIKEIPIVGGVLEKGAELGFEYVFDEMHYHHLLKDAERLENSTIYLTQAFVKDLNRIAEKSVTCNLNKLKRNQRIILFFDTFEQLGGIASNWILNYLLQNNINNNIILVVAGRDSLDKSLPNDPKRWLPYYDDNTIYTLPLETFTEEETYIYLHNRGISDPVHISAIWQKSQGLPLYVSLLTSNPNGKVDPTESIIENFLRWIPEAENTKRKLALDIALLSRPFNRYDLEILDYVPQQGNERDALFRWLVGLPFVSSSLQDGRYSYHNLVQELFTRYLYQYFEKEYYATRRSLVIHYKAQLIQLQSDSPEGKFNSSAWLEINLALIYQLALLNDELSHAEAIEHFFSVLEFTQINEITRQLQKLLDEKYSNLIDHDAQKTIHILIKYMTSITTSNNEEQVSCLDFLIQKLEKNRPSFSQIISKLYNKRGHLHRKLKKYQRSLSDQNYSINLDPNNANYLIERGDLYMLLHEYNRALNDYDSALKIKKEGEHTCQERRGNAFVSLKMYQEALDAFIRAIKADPSCTQPLKGLVKVYVSQYKREGVPSLIKGISIENVDKLTFALNLASTMSENGFSDYALEEISDILAANRDNKRALVIRANILRKNKMYKEAEADLNMAINLASLDANLFLSRGFFYHQIGRKKDAYDDFNKAVELLSNSDQNFFRGYKTIYDLSTPIGSVIRDEYFTALYMRGVINQQLKHYEEALSDFSNLIESNPIYNINRNIDVLYKNDFLYIDRGITYRQNKNFKEALEDFYHVVSENYSYTHTCMKEIGLTYEKLELYPEAINSYIASLEAQPACPHCWTLLARVYIKQYPKEEVAQKLRNAISFTGKGPVTICRAEAMKAIGLHDVAITELDTVIKFHPNNTDARVRMGKIYLELGDHQHANQIFEQAIRIDQKLAPIIKKIKEDASQDKGKK